MADEFKSQELSNEKKSLALNLADLFSDSVECFGMIHAGKKVWDRPQQVILTKLGIQQARLLAWGDIVRICDLSDNRDTSLDDTISRGKIETTLRSIVDMHKTEDKSKQLEKYGLKSTKLTIEDLEHALDLTRLESFRERFALLGPTRHSPKITGLHWLITDTKKILPFVSEIRALVDSLVSLLDVESRISHALKSDIRALAWHPVFVRHKAAADGSKLQLIKEACAEWYPEYSEATEGALSYLNQEWNDSYEESMGNFAYRFRPPGGASEFLAKKAQADAKKSHEDTKKAQADTKKAQADTKKAQADAKRARALAKVAEAAAANQHYSLEHLKEEYTRVDSRHHHNEGKHQPTEGQSNPKRLGILSHFKPMSWRRNSAKPEEAARSMSSGTIGNQTASRAEDDMASLVPARSRSMIVVPSKPLFASIKDKQPDLTKTETKVGQENETEAKKDKMENTVQTIEQESLQPITSMASRHDHWRASIG